MRMEGDHRRLPPWRAYHLQPVSTDRRVSSAAATIHRATALASSSAAAIQAPIA